MNQLSALNFNKNADGLLPVVVQDAATLRVLMVGYMNPDALATTQKTGLVTFWSRSRKTLWQKGETSGNSLSVVSISTDCDADAILIQATPTGPTCHTGTVSCFGGEDVTLGELGALWKRVSTRNKADVKTSYTAELLASGLDRCAQKVGEEGVEVVIAAKNKDVPEFVGECADLLYHLFVLLRAKSVSLKKVLTVLSQRAKR